MTHCTFAGNEAGSDGGAIFREQGTVTITGATITGNRAGTSSSSGTGGGLALSGAGTVRNSIVALNTAAGASADVAGALTVNEFNYIGGTASALALDPAVLQMNGGPTLTIGLLRNSAAINAGSNALIPADTGDADGDGNTTERAPFDKRGPGFHASRSEGWWTSARLSCNPETNRRARSPTASPA